MELTQKIIKELIIYNKETGIINWNPRTSKNAKNVACMKAFNTRFANKIAGNIKKNIKTGRKYYEIKIFSKKYQSHRIIFLYMTGSFPKNEVDHIDGNGLNNKWENLREVNKSDNQRNRKLNKNNSTGCPGVYRLANNKYRVKINHDNKELHLGYYNDLDTAIKIRKKYEIIFNYHINHGIDRN